MVPIIGINGFKPLEASPFNCFFKLFGFSANTTYTCALQSNGSFQEDVTVRTLSEGNVCVQINTNWLNNPLVQYCPLIMMTN